MPQIRPYETGNLALHPTEIGADAQAGAARRIGAFYNQEGAAKEGLGRDTENLGSFEGSLIKDTGNRIGGSIRDAGDAYVAYEDHKEISHGAATFAQLQSDLTTQWKALSANADPNDDSVGPKFRETVLEPALEKFTGAFTTEKSQQFAEAHAAALREQMFHTTSADMTKLAGEAVHENLRQTGTAMSNTAITDPSQVPFLLKSADHSVGAVVDSSPNIGGVDGAILKNSVSNEIKGAIVKAGAFGAIQKSADPEATASEWTSKYPDYISGMEAKTLAANARQQIRSQNYDYELNRRRQKEVATDRSNEATSQYLISVRSQDPKLANDPTAKTILNDPTLTKTDKNNLLNYIDRQLKPETDSRLSQQTFVGLLRDLRSPDANSDQVMQKAWDARLADPGKPGSMSEKDFNQFRTEVQARKTPEGAALETDRASFFKNYGTAIAGATYTPQLGDPKVYNAEMDARRVEADLRKRNLDPHLAYDPSSQYFLGKPDRIAKWSSSMQQDLQTRATSPSGLPPAKDITGVQNEPAPVGTSVPRPAAAKPPEKGMVKDGYEFLGGSPGDVRSWRKIEERS